MDSVRSSRYIIAAATCNKSRLYAVAESRLQYPVQPSLPLAHIGDRHIVVVLHEPERPRGVSPGRPQWERRVGAVQYCTSY